MFFWLALSIEYLGQIISQAGVAMDPAKISCVLQWPVPRNVKGVRGFLGLTGYYRKFIRDYGKMAKPLTELTKKDGFKWGPKAQLAFDLLKQKVTTAPVLALSDYTKEFVIEIDALGSGLGAILLQQGHLIAYYSKALGDRNLAKSAYEKELMAVALSIQHRRSYLLGRKFIVCNDQKSLKQLLMQRITTSDQQNWAAKLLGYHFDIVYKPGLENKGVDALSRMHDPETLCSMVHVPEWSGSKELVEEVHRDPVLQKVIENLKNGVPTNPVFHIEMGRYCMMIVWWWLLI